MNRKSDSFIARLDTQSAQDMLTLQQIKNTVSFLNKGLPQHFKKRVVIRGRKPIIKMKTSGGYFHRDSKGAVAYDIFGNIVGGITNASMYDVYIYKCSY